MNGAQVVQMLCLAIVGIVNTLPVLGMLGAERIASAYGVTVSSPELELLLRHRALLFGLIGGLVLTSLLHADLRVPAIILAGISMAGFVLLARLVPGQGSEIARIVNVDLIALFALLVAAVTSILLARS